MEAARGGRASMSSQTSQQLAAKPTPSSLATIASRLAPAETSSSAGVMGDAKNEKKPAKQLPKARVCPNLQSTTLINQINVPEQITEF